ncbi:DUF1361 domain-containing protein [Hugenholtzia roseola]|uniref:DUF1361 domain-containing protein n=1 Tax=Hugenholtzia roseola TaxID=1002 RepID=UPI0003F94C3A|nr:DUF1361 domain-containing protein [Hugenholtzia roseola]
MALKNKIKYYWLTLLLTGLPALLLLWLRNMLVGNQIYNFLLWNLFLGIIPLVVISAVAYGQGKIGRVFFWFGMGLWLLFYPNAPYMITDLIHINSSSPIVVYDALLIFILAMLSTFAGFYSLSVALDLIQSRSGKNSKVFSWIVLLFSIFMSSLGIYLGRVLRLNSWDIFSKPIQTFVLIIDHLFPISKNPTTYSMIFLFSFLQILLLLWASAPLLQNFFVQDAQKS